MSSKRYTDADLAALLTKQGLPVDFKFRKNRTPSSGPSESQMQQDLIRWWHHACAGFSLSENLLFAIPLQAARSPRNGARMKAEGARAGTPDLMLCVASRWKHGLFLELKTPIGRVSPVQKLMLWTLECQRYTVTVCRSTEEAKRAIEEYLA
jgi:hypothetical protein